MRALLDVNVLIALFDEEHVHNDRAHEWLDANLEQGWASCPLTENGVIRIMSSSAYTATFQQTPANVASRMRDFVAATDHEFWPDNFSICDTTRFNHERILTPRNLTDLYLIALTVERSGRLVTFDLGVPLAAVTGAEAKHMVTL